MAATVPLGQVPGGESLEAIIDSRTLVVRQFPPELQEGAKAALLQVFYDRGGRVRWVSSSECIISFRTQRQTEEAALAFRSNCKLPAEKINNLATSERERSTYYSVATEMHEEFIKPVRDASAAKRMIGAALGIKTQKAEPVPTKLAPQKAAVVDAWDD